MPGLNDCISPAIGEGSSGIESRDRFREFARRTGEILRRDGVVCCVVESSGNDPSVNLPVDSGCGEESAMVGT